MKNVAIDDPHARNIQAGILPDGFSSELLAEVRGLLINSPQLAGLIGIDIGDFADTAGLLACVLAAPMTNVTQREYVREAAYAVFASDENALDSALADIETTSRKNFEPGGITTTLLFSRGIHALLGHRVTHSLWTRGTRDLSLALKTLFGRAFSTDIHPAARFGKGIWLDHGLGFVVGETTIIGDNVSIWHGVTLGSTLKDNSTQRHPRIGSGVTIGADAIVLGGVDIGEGSVIAAGSIVLTDIPAGTTVAGVPAKPKPRSTASFSGI